MLPFSSGAFMVSSGSRALVGLNVRFLEGKWGPEGREWVNSSGLQTGGRTARFRSSAPYELRGKDYSGRSIIGANPRQPDETASAFFVSASSGWKIESNGAFRLIVTEFLDGMAFDLLTSLARLFQAQPPR
jgi:hypothetical protein